MDEGQKQQFIKLTYFLGEVLGEQYVRGILKRTCNYP